MGITPLQLGDHAEGLHIVVEPAERLHAIVQLVLARMAEGRMAQVVGEGDGLGQIVVQAQGLGDRAGHLSHLQRVGQAGAEMVAFVRHEDLGLLLQAAKGRAMDDAVAVAGEGRAGAAVGLWPAPAARTGRVLGIGSAGRRLVGRNGHCGLYRSRPFRWAVRSLI